MPRLRGLYAITPTALCLDPGQLLRAVEAALRGGARLIQYRDKTADHLRRRTSARDLRVLCEQHGAKLIVNDDVELALVVHAHGVHLGLDDAPLRVARARLGPDAIIGITCQDSLPRAQAASAEGADYLALGAFFASRTKPDARRATLPLLRAVRAHSALPICAIGGLTAHNQAEVIAAGADLVAAVEGVFGAPDIQAAARAYATGFDRDCAASAPGFVESRPCPPQERHMSLSEALFMRAQQTIPGGVNSPVRAFRSVGGTPRFVSRAQGAYIHDADGKAYIDYVGSWGPMILGHQHPAVIEAVTKQAAIGMSYGAPTEAEIEMAELLCARVPHLDMVRLCSSGTEATMSALRLARGFTGRDRILKFEGCYHGHGDSLLVKAGSGLLTFGVPTSPGVPAELAKLTLTATYNDLDSVRALFDANRDSIACVIVEPVAGNMNCVPPAPGFLEGLRELCTQFGALLIFDEVMTGFRVGPTSAAGRFGIAPDLITLGKIIGGGLPVGAFGGRRDVMQKLAPLGAVYQAGTLSGNPLAMSAGLALLRALDDSSIYTRLDASTRTLCAGLQAVADAAGIAFTTTQVGSMFGLYFGKGPIRGLADVSACDIQRFKRFFHLMLERGVYLAPSAYEAGFVSAAHGEAEIAQTLDAAREAFAQLNGGA